MQRRYEGNPASSESKCDAIVIWETTHKVGKSDFEIFKAPHRKEKEEYSAEKKSQKLNSTSRYAF